MREANTAKQNLAKQSAKQEQLTKQEHSVKQEVPHKEYVTFIENLNEAKEFLRSEFVSKTLVISLNENICEYLGKNNISFKRLAEYDTEKEDMIDITTKWVKKLSAIRVFGNKNIREYLLVDDLSIWFLLELWICSDTRLVTPTLVDIFRKIGTLDAAVRSEKKKLLIFDSGSEMNGYLKRFNVKKVVLKVKKVYSSDKGKLILSAKYLRWGYRKMLSLFRSTNKIESEKIRIIGFSPHMVDSFDGKNVVKQDVYLEFLKKLGSGFQMTVIDPPIGFSFGLPKRENTGVRYITFEKYLDLGVIARAIKKHNVLKKQWSAVSKSKVIKHCVYKGVDFSGIMLKSLDFFFEHYLFSLLVELEMYDKIMKKEHPKVAVLFYATTLIGRMIVYAAKKNNVLTIGIPHGLVVYGPEITHTPEEINQTNMVEKGKCPIPDVICIGGKKEMIVYCRGGSHKKGWLRSTGFPKYDIVPGIRKIYDRKKTLVSLGLKNTRTVLFASQPLLEQQLCGLVRLVAGALYGTNYQVIVKLHPMEYSGFGFHKKIFDEFGVKNVVYVKEMPILEVLSAVDVVLSPYSTVLSEGAALEKPFILLEYYQLEYSKLMGSDKVLATYDSAELKRYIQKIMENPDFRKEYVKEMKRIAGNQLGRIDGNASVRVAAVIKSLVKSK